MPQEERERLEFNFIQTVKPRVDARGSLRFLPNILAAGLTLSSFLSLATVGCGDRSTILKQTPTPTVASQQETDKLYEIVLPPSQYVTEWYLRDYLINDWAARSLEQFNKKFDVSMLDEPVQIKVKHEEVFIIRDFPDQKIGREIPTGLPGNQLQYKRLYSREYAGMFRDFVVMRDPDSGEVESIWAAYWTAEGGWSNREQPHFETFLVYLKDELKQGRNPWLAVFIDEESAIKNGTVPGEEVFRKAHPPVKVTTSTTY